MRGFGMCFHEMTEHGIELAGMGHIVPPERRADVFGDHPKDRLGPVVKMHRVFRKGGRADEGQALVFSDGRDLLMREVGHVHDVVEVDHVALPVAAKQLWHMFRQRGLTEVKGCATFSAVASGTCAMQGRAGYTALQIGLHWATVALVALQYLLHDGMTMAFDAGLKAGSMVFTTGALGHMIGGALILIMASWRLLLRDAGPSPAPAAGEPAWAAWLAPLVHRVFYALLIALPITGGLAWGMASEFMGDMHEALRAALLFLIAAHVAAVILHQVVWKTGILARMTRPLR